MELKFNNAYQVPIKNLSNIQKFKPDLHLSLNQTECPTFHIWKTFDSCFVLSSCHTWPQLYYLQHILLQNPNMSLFVQTFNCASEYSSHKRCCIAPKNKFTCIEKHENEIKYTLQKTGSIELHDNFETGMKREEISQQ